MAKDSAKNESFTKEQEEEAKQYFDDFKYKSYSEDDMDKVTENEESIMDKMGDKRLSDFIKPAKTFFRMLKAYKNKTYREIPVPAIVSIIMTLLYVFSPIDLIPDFIPIAGLLDDATVMGACVAAFGSAIKKFEEWESQQKENDSPADN